MDDAKTAFLNEVLRPSKKVGDVPVLSPFKGGDYYYMRATIYWEPEGADVQRLSRVDVPIGFVTDLTSIPSVFWSVLPRDGAYLHAAIVHDYCYWTQTGTRDVADETLRLGRRDLGVSAWQITTIYDAIRLPGVGGSRSWAKNAELKAAGERRVLKRYPIDPRTT